MIYDLTNIRKGIFCFLLIIIQWVTISSAENRGEIADFKNNDKLVPRAKLGEYCWVEFCQKNQFCNEEFICQCRPGYKILNNDCVTVAGENEACVKQEDCGKGLICINGICRKPIPSNEFVTLAKICLVITVVTILVAVFSSLYKCLRKSNSSRASQRPGDSSCQNSAYTFRSQLNSSRSLYEVQEDKPPSYEECIYSTERNTLALPPPYVIFTNSNAITAENRPITQPINTSVNSQSLIPLNVQNLSREINSNLIITQTSEKIYSNT